MKNTTKPPSIRGIHYEKINTKISTDNNPSITNQRGDWYVFDNGMAIRTRWKIPKTPQNWPGMRWLSPE
jgi:hypothetical protein